MRDWNNGRLDKWDDASMKFKESDIRPDNMVKAQQKYITADRNRLLKHKKNFVIVSCPACGRVSSKHAFEKNGLKYVICPRCETLYVNPRPTAAVLEECYAKSEVYAYWNKHIFPVSETVRREKIFRPRVKRVLEICRRYGIKKPKLLEVGAGYGSFCQEAVDRGKFGKVIAVEPFPGCARMCRCRGLKTIDKPIERVRFKDGEIDVVASFEVIEHLFSPRNFLMGCANALSSGGLLLLSCPNFKGFDIFVLQKYSQSVDHEHLNYFTPSSLARLVSDCRFEVLETLTPGQLDAEIVRKTVLRGDFDISRQPFLKQILIDEWERVGDSFQKFLSDNLLSSHLWLVARKTTRQGQF